MWNFFLIINWPFSLNFAIYLQTSSCCDFNIAGFWKRFVVNLRNFRLINCPSFALTKQVALLFSITLKCCIKVIKKHLWIVVGSSWRAKQTVRHLRGLRNVRMLRGFLACWVSFWSCWSWYEGSSKILGLNGSEIFLDSPNLFWGFRIHN